MSKRGQLTLNELYILSVLLKGRKFGLEILNELKDSGFELSLGSLYNTLNALLDKNYIEKERNISEMKIKKKGNTRKYFLITSIGMNKLNQTKIILQKIWKTEETTLKDEEKNWRGIGAIGEDDY